MKLLITTFALVFLRGLQQQNVIHGNYLWASILPYFLACAEVATVLWVVETGWPAVPWIGTGGALGIVSAMLFHRRVVRK